MVKKSLTRRKPDSNMLEKDLERWCRRYAKAHGFGFFKWASPSQRGVSDRILLGPGGYVAFVEMKRPCRKPALTPLQQKHRDQLLDMGHRHYVINSRDGFIELVDDAFACIAAAIPAEGGRLRL